MYETKYSHTLGVLSGHLSVPIPNRSPTPSSIAVQHEEAMCAVPVFPFISCITVSCLFCSAIYVQSKPFTEGGS